MSNLSKKILIDAGHGGHDVSNRGQSGYIEADGTLAMSKAALEYLLANGVTASLTRYLDVDLCDYPTYSQGCDLAGRVALATRVGADLFVSIHTNAANGKARGTETYVQRNSPESQNLGFMIHSAVVDACGTEDRGVRARNYANGGIYKLSSATPAFDVDYYYLHRNLSIPSVIVEVAFHDNPADEAMLKQPAFLKRAGEAIAQGIMEYLGVKPQEESEGTPIVARPTISANQAALWAISRGAPAGIVKKLANCYWDFSDRANAEVLFAQAMKETGMLKFGGVIDASFNNWCGLKTAKGGANNDPDAHARFERMSDGVMAHIQHLELYAGLDEFIADDKPETMYDPRHFPSLHGTAKTVEALGGKWAPSPDYGISIVRDYLEPMIEFARTWKPEPVAEPEPEQPTESLVIPKTPETPTEMLHVLKAVLAFLQRMVAKFLG